ncbi:MAG: hypothetical protein HY928_07205 [Elusimicrobia bacterium]|nr:hypothetical protein [Elusimicrobiota bacterium]
MTTSGRARLLCACGLLAVGGCALAPVRARYFPVPAPEQARLPDGWTVSCKGRLAAGKAALARSGALVFAHIEVHNESSDAPLRLSGIRAFDKDRTLLAGEGAQVPAPADFSGAGAYRDDPVPKGLSNRGLAAFRLADRAPPFTLELELTDGAAAETLTFAFKEFGPEEFWGNPELVMQDPARFFRSLKFEERQDAFEAARRMRRDRESFLRMKTADPKRYELLEWVRIHEYDIEF